MNPLPEYVAGDIKDLIYQMLTVDPIKRPNVDILLDSEIMIHQAQLEKENEGQFQDEQIAEKLVEAMNLGQRTFKLKSGIQKLKTGVHDSKVKKVEEENRKLKLMLENVS
ncbi:MAG: hypothetical protein EZS28_042653, partial [Streblomastix strix]